MRRVPAPPPPASLAGEKAAAERRAAAEFYADGTWDGVAKYDKYSAYKSPDVRAALEAAFGQRCAYCECDYGKSQPVAVEHYRPKGEVTIGGKRTPPGYYWLAGEWTNLLPSCTDCNSPRKQDLPGSTGTAGKANAFPLASERTRARRPGDESKERRLILHPYLDDPEKHLEFVWDTGTISDGWVRARRSASGRPSAKGTKTIEVCALQRRGLVAARRATLLRLVSALETVVEAKENIARHPGDPELVRQFQRRLDDVALFVADGAEFSAMARQVVAAYHARLFGP